MIQSHEETIMAYKIANLLNFYRVTFSKLLGEDSVLLDSLSTLEEAALRQFRSLMRDHVAALQAETHAPPADLSPPDFLQDGLKQLTAIMKTYETSFTPADSREAIFLPILTEAFDPFMKGSEQLAEDLESPRDSTYSINCLLAARNILAAFDFTTQRVADIQTSIEKCASQLIEHQYSFFRTNSALEPLLQALAPLSDTKEDLKSIRSLGPFQPEPLTQASQTLDDFLPSALMDAMENLKQLQSSKLTREITEAAAERFCDEFEQVEDKLVAADELWEEDNDEKEPLRAFFPRTGGEIRVLLS